MDIKIPINCRRSYEMKTKKIICVLILIVVSILFVFLTKKRSFLKFYTKLVGYYINSLYLCRQIITNGLERALLSKEIKEKKI